MIKFDKVNMVWNIFFLQNNKWNKVMYGINDMSYMNYEMCTFFGKTISSNILLNELIAVYTVSEMKINRNIV